MRFLRRSVFVSLVLASLCILVTFTLSAQTAHGLKLENIRMRDICDLCRSRDEDLLRDRIGRVPAKEGFRNSSVRTYTSKDLINWEGPHRRSFKRRLTCGAM